MSRAVGVMKNPFPGLRGGFRAEAAQKGPAARRPPKAAREPYSLYGERAAEGANEADGPLSFACRLGEHVLPDTVGPPDRVLRARFRLARRELLLDLDDLAALDLVAVDDRDRL